MGMSNAEKQRKYRLNRDADQQRRQQYLEKSKQKYKDDKNVGKRKSVKDMTKREQRHIRKQWRVEKRKRKARQNKSNQSSETPQSPTTVNKHSSRQKEQSKRKKANEMAKCYRDNTSHLNEIEDLRRKVAMYKQRWLREKSKGGDPETPRTKTRKLLRSFSKEKVKRSLFKYHVLTEQVRQMYRDENKQNKLRFARNLNGSILRKYKLKSETFKLLGIHTKGLGHKYKKTSMSKRLFQKVRAFYVRDDNSRILSGLKQTVTRKKSKKQKRILSDSLLNLHKKFLAEEKTKLSYTLFCRLRPFWVVFPSEADRNTCLCKKCDNVTLMVKSLYKAKAIETDKLECLLEKRVCDTKSYKCMNGICAECSKNIWKRKETEFNVTWYKWITKTEKRFLKDGIEKQITITVKESITDTSENALKQFNTDFEAYMKHIYNCWTEFGHYKKARETLKENACIMHVDFSENYVCKMSSEIQSMHFGANQKQITLHTGVYYVGQSKPQTFCTVAESLNHGPGGIWAHLKKMLTKLKEEHPNVDSIEFFSDGPTTQYKQKFNFYLLSTEPREMGFKNVKWSFFEAGHGKGIPDGVGGTLKRQADRKVRFGKDIISAKQFVTEMENGKTKVIIVNDSEIEAEQTKLNNIRIKPVPGTMKLHQVIIRSTGSIAYRKLSCSCDDGTCELCIERSEPLRKCTIIDEPKAKTPKGTKRKLSDGARDSSETKQAKTISQKQKTVGNGNRNDDDAMNQMLSEDEERKLVFKRCLSELNDSRTYTELKRKSRNVQLEKYKISYEDVNFCSDRFDDLEADFDAVDYMPDDINSDKDLCPCRVNADGNCLPSCGSAIAFGKIDNVEEIRVRIIKELIENEERYLNDKFLTNGMQKTKSGQNKTKPSVSYAQYSDMFVAGSKLDKKEIKKLYRREVMSITEDKTFMGMWQLHALASVLNRPIYSVYPNLGSTAVRHDLNRLILPASGADENPCFILWTSNRTDMTKEHWVPNHFVPLFPILLDNELVDQAASQYTSTGNTENVNIDNENGTCSIQNNKGNESNIESGSGDRITIYVYEGDEHERSFQDKTYQPKNNTENEDKFVEHEVKKDSNMKMECESLDAENTSTVSEKPRMYNENVTSVNRDDDECELRMSCSEEEITESELDENCNIKPTDSKANKIELSNFEKEEPIDRIKPNTDEEQTNNACEDQTIIYVYEGDEQIGSVKDETYHSYHECEDEDNSTMRRINKHEIKTKPERGLKSMEDDENKMESYVNNGKSEINTENDICVEKDDSYDKNNNREDKDNVESDKSSECENKVNIYVYEGEKHVGSFENGTYQTHVHDINNNELKNKEQGSRCMDDIENQVKPKVRIETEISMVNMDEDCMINKVTKESHDGKEKTVECEMRFEASEMKRTELHGDEKSNIGRNDLSQVSGGLKEWLNNDQMETSQYETGINTVLKSRDESDVETDVKSDLRINESEFTRSEQFISQKELKGTLGISEITNETIDNEIPAEIEINREGEKSMPNNHEVKNKDILPLASAIKDPLMCISKHVIITYNGRPYVGIVEKAFENSLLVKCMKKAGKKSDNIFTWPRKITDCNWYDVDNIVGVIPPPEPVSERSSQYMLAAHIWEHYFA